MVAHLINLNVVLAKPQFDGGTSLGRSTARRIDDDTVLLAEPCHSLARAVDWKVRNDG